MSISLGPSPSWTGSPLIESDSRPFAGLMLVMSTRTTMFCPIRAVAGATTRSTITSCSNLYRRGSTSIGTCEVRATPAASCTLPVVSLKSEMYKIRLAAAWPSVSCPGTASAMCTPASRFVASVSPSVCDSALSFGFVGSAAAHATALAFATVSRVSVSPGVAELVRRLPQIRIHVRRHLHHLPVRQLQRPGAHRVAHIHDDCDVDALGLFPPVRPGNGAHHQQHHDQSNQQRDPARRRPHPRERLPPDPHHQHPADRRQDQPERLIELHRASVERECEPREGE